MIATSKTFQRQQTFSFRNTLPQEPPAVAQPVEETEKQVEDELEAEMPMPETVPEKAVEEITEAAEPEEADLATALLYFGLFNLLLLIIAINGFLIYRHLKKNKPAESDAD
jgi:hypothetical protein